MYRIQKDMTNVIESKTNDKIIIIILSIIIYLDVIYHSSILNLRCIKNLLQFLLQSHVFTITFRQSNLARLCFYRVLSILHIF